MAITTIDISHLTVAEKLDLIDRLWDSIEAEHGSPHAEPVESPELIAELKRRLEAHERDPSSAIPAEEVFRKLNAEIDSYRK
jgi:putative addiction module component (TIGR02574 family)